MTISRLRTTSIGLALLCAFAQAPALADDTTDTAPTTRAMPQVVRGSAGNAKPAAPRPAAKTPCVPTPEAKTAATAASGINGLYVGSRWVTGTMSPEGAAALSGAAQSYGCER